MIKAPGWKGLLRSYTLVYLASGTKKKSCITLTQDLSTGSLNALTRTCWRRRTWPSFPLLPSKAPPKAWSSASATTRSSVESPASLQVSIFFEKLFSSSPMAVLISLNREYLRGKYHCTIDLLFDWFGLVCFGNKNKNCQLLYS
jgi:hypothetical protein